MAMLNNAIDVVAEHIAYDMKARDRKSEIIWLLEQVYKDVESLDDDWDLESLLKKEEE